MQPITLTPELVRTLLSVDPSDGKIYWLVSHGRWAHLPAGELAGCLRGGYRYIHIQGKNHFGHRLSWLMSYGEWPATTLDHINGDRDDNRIENLRLATVTENNQNQHGTPKHNTSGTRGVSWDEARQMWTARISINNKSVNLGRFPSKEQATNAYIEAKRRHHPGNHEAQQ